MNKQPAPRVKNVFVFSEVGLFYQRCHVFIFLKNTTKMGREKKALFFFLMGTGISKTPLLKLNAFLSGQFQFM